MFNVHKSGFAQIIPLLVIVLFLTSAGVATSLKSENAQKQNVGRVLSDQEDRDDELTETEKKADEAQKEAEERKMELEKKASENTSKSKTVTKNEKEETEIETENGKTKIKIKNADGEFETEIEKGKEKTKFQAKNYKIEFERQGNKFVTKFKDEDGKDAELETTEEAELLENLEDELDDQDIDIATNSAQLGFVQKGNRVRTNFPLSVNPQTGELFVTTPKGTKVVTILPDVAIQNMISAGVMTRTSEPPFPPSEPPEATSSTQQASVAPDLDAASIELAELDGEPIYIIDGVKDEEFLGIIPVEIKVKTKVSATDGRLVDISQGFITRLLDLLAF